MNEPRRRGPVARVVFGLWDAMNFTRRLLFNLLFFAILLMILAAIGAADRAKPLPTRSTLVFAPEGRLVEQYSSDPLSRALSKVVGDDRNAEVQLRDLLRALDAARTDTRIERVVLNLDRLQPTGMASLRDVAAGIGKLRASGKQVVAFTEGMEQGQYLLAAQASEIYLDPMGGILLEGLDRHRQYYREGLQDKLGVDVHLFRVGEFKSAAEPYILDAASPEAKEADLFWMNDVWQRYLADVARARKITPAQLAAGIDGIPEGVAALGGDLAKYALQQRLVDGLKTREQVQDLLTQRGVTDQDAEGGFRQVALDGYLKHLDGALAASPQAQVAVVVAEGEISGGEQPPGSVGGESTAALLRDARDEDAIKAVVLRVDSPGGEVFASEQIRREVVELKKAGKPVVVSMGDMAASGGYWISMDADRIYADPSTITGSIGIFGLIPTIPRTLDKIGVHTDGVGTTRLAGAFDLTRPLNPAVGQLIQAVIDKGYRDFTGKVATARGRSQTAIDEVGRGRVWSGAQARQRGLVDTFGGLDAALTDAARRAKLGKPDAWRVRYMEKAATPFERFFSGFAGSRVGAAWLRSSPLLRGVAGLAVPHMDADLRLLERALSAPSTQVRGLAYCFCGL